MNEVMLAFVDIVKVVAPIDIAWCLGIKAYRFIVNALTGRNASL